MKNIFTAFWLRWGVYSIIAFLTMLAVISKLPRIGCIILIVAYGLYVIGDTFKQYTEAYNYTHNKDKSILSALSNNYLDIILYMISIIIGIYLGGY